MSSGKEILKLAQIYSEAANSEYMRNYMAKRYHDKRNAIISTLGGKCARCGRKDNLHIDHKDASKKTFRAADIHSISDEKVKEGLKGLQLLCEDCHKKKTREAWDFGTNKSHHGTAWHYRRYGCRCPACTKAFKESKVRERERVKKTD